MNVEKRATIGLVLLLVLGLGGLVGVYLALAQQPGIVEIVVCTAANDQYHPDVFGNVVVWHDWRSGLSNADIYGYNLSTSQEFTVCTAVNNQQVPAIDGNVVVWQDGRSGIGDDIYGHNLGTGQEFTVCTAADDQRWPAIDGNVVVWTDRRSGSNYDIYGYNLGTSQEFTVCTTANDQQSPAIYGNVVVWTDYRSGSYGDIYGYNMSTGQEFTVCTAANDQTNPAIYGNVVVWQDRRSGIDDIYGYNLDTKQEFTVCTVANDQWDPAIYHNIAVWQDKRSGSFNVYGYNLGTKQEFTVCIVANDQIHAAIHGHVVAWVDYRSGTNYNVYAARLQSTSVTTFTNQAGEAVSGYYVGGGIYVTVNDPDENENPLAQDSVSVTVSDAATGDSETLALTETGNNTGVFRNTAALPSTPAPALSAMVTSGNGILETQPGHTIKADYADPDYGADTSFDTATMLAPGASLTTFTDSAGGKKNVYNIGLEGIYVTVNDSDENTNALSKQTVSVSVVNLSTGDSETLTLTETGHNTGIFRNVTALPSSESATGAPGNGTLEARSGHTIRATYTDDDDPADTSFDTAKTLLYGASLTTFTNAEGMEVNAYVIGADPIYVTVIDADENTSSAGRQAVSVVVSEAATGDSETLALLETGDNTGQFRNPIGLPSRDVATGTPGNGLLETKVGHGIRASYTDDDDGNDQSSNLAAIRDFFNVHLPAVLRGYPQLVNGDFEGEGGWSFGGMERHAVSTVMAHGGSQSALLGGDKSVYDCEGGIPQDQRAWMEQTVTVPSTGSPALTFWYRLYSHDKKPSDKPYGDTLEVKVNGDTVFSDILDWAAAYGCDLPAPNDRGWQQGTIGLSAYKGQAITLRFEVWNRNDAWYNTWAYIDDVSLE